MSNPEKWSHLKVWHGMLAQYPFHQSLYLTGIVVLKLPLRAKLMIISFDSHELNFILFCPLSSNINRSL